MLYCPIRLSIKFGPRLNHERMISPWAQLKVDTDPSLLSLIMKVSPAKNRTLSSSLFIS